MTDIEQPIVYYEGSEARVLSIVRQNSEFVKNVQSFPADKPFSIKVLHEPWEFKVSVRKVHSTPEEEYTMPEKLIAVSDIEGNFDGFRRFLMGTGVISERFEWTFGYGHLVLLGDYFDRDPWVNEILWLIYKLEPEAEKAGGKVHFILGNHETMNLTGPYEPRQLAYVHQKLFDNARFLGHAYTGWYTPDTELGQWLRSKNSMEKIGDTLFVHGGISPAIAASRLSIHDINTITRQGVDKPSMSYSREEALVLHNEGPHWYRGLANGTVPDHVLDSILEAFKCIRIVMGHSVVPQVTPLYNGRVIDIDLHHTTNQYVAGLLIENNVYHEVNETGGLRKL